ncbi:DUF4190 domain-containing protein [Aeromicrobium alkaliterrae]|uniref:Septum formation-related domain-containing protein n=1 Tax=Aeromicrobium alkaliterrae TaxID=302168 RepID=A0ABN2JLP7_9ACTN
MSHQPPPGNDPYGSPPQLYPPQGYGYPPAGYPGYPGYPPGMPGLPPDPQAAARSRTQAVWALVLAIVPLCLSQIVAVVLAIIVLAGRRDGQRRGKGMAAAALVIVVLWIVAAVVAIVVAAVTITPERDNQGVVISGGEELPEDVRVGDCVDEDVTYPSAKGFFVTVVPCDEPHPGEVFAEIEIEYLDYPGPTRVREIGDAGCAERFEAFVGVPLEASELDVSYFYPTEDNWEYDGMIRCIVVPPEDVTGTLEGSGR